ncbi:hypothetical protein NLI96_g10971 [Meripilus lineatus]|uniref:Phosphatidic acid phosphatase type 2/haloperoxidase domain-containing protein n=1 Tax=Meripilus lineatus TaxID=2056292 RepID=A0AAD5USR4_9APHY|nr:hypothetical protein NLI96_g10971 [Physisporinus lineatus]
MNFGGSISRSLKGVWVALQAGVARLDKSVSPLDTITRFRQHRFTLKDSIYLLHIFLATFWISLMQAPGFPLKLLIPILYAIALLIPFTSQFFIPATPVFSWILTFYSARFIPDNFRPKISVVLLPTLESVLYGANISDILTRTTHPLLDIIAWIPYGVVHYTFPFVVAAFLWLFRTKEALHQWARIFGYLNLAGVWIQILLPCAPPWYELIYGLTPANYSMRGSPAGLGRIDKLFHSNGYTLAFSNSPVVFGAFPSLHSACATIEALFISHFFPQATKWIWSYTLVLYWATMYLTHHYLIDVVGGSCMAVAFFYLMLPDDLKGQAAFATPPNLNNGSRRSKYEIYDLEEPRTSGRGGRGANGSIMQDAADFDLDDMVSDEEERDITYRSPVVPQMPNSAPPILKTMAGKSTGGRGSHRHTASIASLIRAEERAEDGWSPIGGSFKIPSVPSDRTTDV